MGSSPGTEFPPGAERRCPSTPQHFPGPKKNPIPPVLCWSPQGGFGRHGPFPEWVRSRRLLSNATLASAQAKEALLGTCPLYKTEPQPCKGDRRGAVMGSQTRQQLVQPPPSTPLGGGGVHDPLFLPGTLLPLTAAARPQGLGSSSVWAPTTQRFPRPGLHWRVPPTGWCAGVGSYYWLLVTLLQELEIGRGGSLHTTEISRPCGSALFRGLHASCSTSANTPLCAPPSLPGTPHFTPHFTPQCLRFSGTVKTPPTCGV